MTYNASLTISLEDYRVDNVQSQEKTGDVVGSVDSSRNADEPVDPVRGVVKQSDGPHPGQVMEALSDFEPKPLLEGWEGHRPNDQRGREHSRQAGDSRCRRGQEANVAIPQRPAQNMEEGVGHRLNTNYNAKCVVDVVHVTEVDPPAEDCVAKEIVEVVSLAQKHHHVERIVEEGRRARGPEGPCRAGYQCRWWRGDKHTWPCHPGIRRRRAAWRPRPMAVACRMGVGVEPAEGRRPS